MFIYRLESTRSEPVHSPSSGAGGGRPPSGDGYGSSSRPRSMDLISDPHGNIIVTKNVVITARLDPSRTDTLPRYTELPVEQEDHLQQSRLSGNRLSGGNFGPGSSSGPAPTSTRTYVAPDGTVITEVGFLKE